MKGNFICIKKSTIIGFGLILLGIIAIVSVFIVVLNVVNSPANNIEKQWGVALPPGIKTEYHLNNIGWFGEGERFTVFTLDPDNARHASFVKQRFGKISAGGGEADDPSLFEQVIDKLFSDYADIPEKYAPVWSDQYYWYAANSFSLSDYLASNLFMIYFPERSRLIVCESFF